LITAWPVKDFFKNQPAVKEMFWVDNIAICLIQISYLLFSGNIFFNG